MGSVRIIIRGPVKTPVRTVVGKENTLGRTVRITDRPLWAASV